MSTMERRKRRTFTPEFRAEAVRLVRETGKPIAEVARDLGMWRSVLDKWVKQARVDDGRGAPGELTTDAKQELTRLRKENRELRMERELLKKWAAFFAKESQ
jgi:transposase